MLLKKNVNLVSIFFFTMLMALYSNIASAESYPMAEKLKQCKQEFNIAHKKDATQEVAVAAKLKHLKLMKEILTQINIKNTGKKMTTAELQDQVMVMSHLLEMLVAENLNEKFNSWNLNL